MDASCESQLTGAGAGRRMATLPVPCCKRVPHWKDGNTATSTKDRSPLIEAHLHFTPQREMCTLDAVTSDGTLSNGYKERLARGADCDRDWRDRVSRATDRPSF